MNETSSPTPKKRKEKRSDAQSDEAEEAH